MLCPRAKSSDDFHGNKYKTSATYNITMDTQKRGGRRAKREKSEVQQLGHTFFTFVSGLKGGPYTDKEDLRDIFKKGFRESLRLTGTSAGYCFATMMYDLREMNFISYRGGKVIVHKSAGLPILDQYYTGRNNDKGTKKKAETTSSDKPSAYPAFCELCSIWISSETSHQQHLQGAKHRYQLKMQVVKVNQKELSKHKYGVQIHVDGREMPDGKMKVNGQVGEQSEVDLMIYAANNKVRLMAGVVLTSDMSVGMIDDFNISKGKQRIDLEIGACYQVKLTCTPTTIGNISAPVAFSFKCLQTKKIFHIFRYILFSTKTEDPDIEDLLPKVPYTGPTRVSLKPWPGNLVQGEPLPESATQKGKKYLSMQQMKNYKIPEKLRRSLNFKPELENMKEELICELTEASYKVKFDKLLFIEECQMDVDIRRYDMKDQTFANDSNKKFLRLKVPGLAEKRPSVLKGDVVNARIVGSNDDKVYQGVVHRVEDVQLVLGFSKKLLDKYVPGMKFDIQFTISRFPLKLQHHALEYISLSDLHPVIIPNEDTICTSQYEGPQLLEFSQFKKDLFDLKLKENDEQSQAVFHILKGSSQPAPYLVFGPPGTGKTVTVVEAIKQVYSKIKDSRILACAPSNSAADLITKRLLIGKNGTPVAKTTLLQMCAKSRSWNGIDPELIQGKCGECFNYDDDKEVFYPPKEKIMEKRIIVTTLVSAGRLVLGSIPKGHFTHIFIDEAGHAVEPEAIIPISTLLDPKGANGGQLVLAGDPQQLGPVLRSPVAKECGLQLSLLERLMKKSGPYQRKTNSPTPYNNKILTKLVKNYRSHPAILELPNQMFYDKELEVCADELMRNCLCGFEELPKKDFPIIFHGVDGTDRREGNSPSFFNVEEVDCVHRYVQAILQKKGGKKILNSDIGIISPYRRQVQKIQEILRKKKIKDIKVGSVEEFQGAERLIIIISTVRSTKEEYIKMDADFKLGFLKNPKRFNVAITRAKALLICVGNPYSLCKDEHWNKFLNYVRDNGGYKGCNYTPDDSDMEEVLKKFETLGLEESEMSVSDANAVDDPEWRGDM